MGKKRYAESNEELMRKDITQNVAQNIKVSPAYKVARFVDSPVLERTVLHQYGRFNQALRKEVQNDKYTAMLDRYHPKGERNVKIDRRFIKVNDIAPEMSIEQVYFNLYGKGFDGTPYPTPIHQIYRCPKCGMKIGMDPAVMPEECPRCRSLLPVGRIVKDGFKNRL